VRTRLDDRRTRQAVGVGEGVDVEHGEHAARCGLGGGDLRTVAGRRGVRLGGRSRMRRRGDLLWNGARPLGGSPERGECRVRGLHRVRRVAAGRRRRVRPSRWPGVGRLALLHRVGRLEVGEVSVVVAVSTPHRSEAFEASRFCIDELKESVPIWKHETWAGGSGWAECGHREGSGPPDTVDVGGAAGGGHGS